MGDKIGSGKTVVMRYLGEKEFNKGDVLYLFDRSDWEPIMKKASRLYEKEEEPVMQQLFVRDTGACRCRKLFTGVRG